LPFKNAVFVGDSPQDMHGENADEQLANLQKQICLIEFLHMGLIIVYQGSGGAAKIQKSGFTRFFYFASTPGFEPRFTMSETNEVRVPTARMTNSEWGCFAILSQVRKSVGKN
jgi:hypothetical protein